MIDLLTIVHGHKPNISNIRRTQTLWLNKKNIVEKTSLSTTLSHLYEKNRLVTYWSSNLTIHKKAA